MRGDRYLLVHRPRSEIADNDPLTKLLWSCGLDPHDQQIRAASWRHLVRALGGQGEGREEVRRRLERRHDRRLTGLLDAMDAQRNVQASGDPWPPAWQYVNEPVEDTALFALCGADETIRVAVGVADVTGQRERELIVTDGGLAWLPQQMAPDLESIDDVLRQPIKGLVPATLRAGWVRWLRSEHAARRAALAGERWHARVGDAGWTSDGVGFGSLLDFLESISCRDCVAMPPEGPVRTLYPRAALAFERAVESAITNGLQLICADSSTGFRAVFKEGHEQSGTGLLDVVVPSGSGPLE